MTILALVSDKTFDSKVDMVVVTMDELSHTVICHCQWTNKSGQISHGLAEIFHKTSAKTGRISTDDPMWCSVPYHVTTLQKM
jgi:hypothetical protein